MYKHCPRCIEDYQDDEGITRAGTREPSTCPTCGVCANCEHMSDCDPYAPCTRPDCDKTITHSDSAHN